MPNDSSIYLYSTAGIKNIYSVIYYVPGISTLHVLIYLTSQYAYEGGTIIIPLLQMQKQRHREVKNLL